MNKIRIIGLIMLIAGVAFPFFFENDKMSFFVGILVGAGITLLLRGTTKRKK